MTNLAKVSGEDDSQATPHVLWIVIWSMRCSSAEVLGNSCEQGGVDHRHFVDNNANYFITVLALELSELGGSELGVFVSRIDGQAGMNSLAVWQQRSSRASECERLHGHAAGGQ